MPFVVTVALGAAAGCGGTVTERGGESDGTGGTSGSGGGNGPSRGGQDERGGTSPIGSGGQYELGGATAAAGGGNPPYPPVDTVCPPVPPGGGSCNYVGPPCGYYDCYGRPATAAACVNGVWSVSTSSCNPPPPLEPCPMVVPQPGLYCNHQGDACGYHLYADGCTYLDTLATCNAHVWTVSTSFCGIQDGGASLDSGMAFDGR